MSTYLQLGHDSWNLIEEDADHIFRGAILSPVNDSPENVRERLKRLGDRRGDLEIILDPQLYNPASQRGKLSSWEYFGKDFDTADRSDLGWWAAKAGGIAAEAQMVGADAICSPAELPRVWSNDYYRFVVDVANTTSAVSRLLGIETLLTAIVPLGILADTNRSLELASILSSSHCDRIYLSFLADREELREPLRDGSTLASAVHLVRLLSQSHRVHAGCAGHDVVLWKAAGAADASSGKFLNVRRFSPSRWHADETEGRQVPYWCDDQLVTLLREQDVMRLHREGWFSQKDFSENPASRKILDILLEGQGKPWQKLSWLQYLRWFANVDTGINDMESGQRLLNDVDNAWGRALQLKVLFHDRFNDGGHIRAWINALNEGGSR